MPLPYIKKIHNKTGIALSELEKKWEEAKKKVKGTPNEDNWKYITFLFQKMVGLKESNIISFNEFLNEAFVSKEVEFGTDGIDRKFTKKSFGNTELLVTFFEYQGNKIKVVYYFDDGSFSFSVYSEKQQKWKLHHSTNDKEISNMMGLYNSLLTIVEALVDQYDIKLISFTNSEDRLKSIYNKIFKSPSFVIFLTNLGFQKEQVGNEYIFKK